MKKNGLLIVLYQKMSDLTAPKCATACKIPHSCCSKEYCEMAMEIAKESGEVLEPTGHEKLPLMGPNGCVARPDLRPLCTLHVCSINSIGADLSDKPWTREYFALRQQIEVAEIAAKRF